MLRTITGATLLGVGLVGLVLPIPGALLLGLGAAVLGENHRLVRPVLARLRGWRVSGRG